MKRSEYLKKLPKKRIAAGALFFDEEDRLLILKPAYKEHWTIPGGVIEGGESLTNGVGREIKEEIDLDVSPNKIVALEYKAVERGGLKEESIQFLFLGKILSGEEKKNIKIDRKEIVDFEFTPKNNAIKKLSPSLSKRLEHVFKVNDFNKTVFIENGKIVA